MALNKSIQNKNGVITEYHRLDHAVIDHNRTLTCLLNSYLSKQYAIDGNEVHSNVFTFTNIPIEEEESMGLRQLAYKKIKEEIDWADAIDC